MYAGQVSVIGAGLSGLIAAHAWKGAQIFESAPAPLAQHQALLRFRSDAVSRLTGVPFRKVLVRKGIVSNDQFCTPNIKLANAYAMKVTGGISGDRSVWNIDPVERFIAPMDLYDRLVKAVDSRIHWGCDGLSETNGVTPIVSTAPLPVVIDRKLRAARRVFSRATITVNRYKVNADAFQTIYFPDASTPIYRASITGDTLIVESMIPFDVNQLGVALDAFGITYSDIVPESSVDQKYGKIVPIPDDERKSILYALTKRYNIYSLGRFATWRNILLDDVVNDIARIDAMISSSDYERASRMAF